MTNNPCYECKTRTAKCHGICPSYAKWQKEHEADMRAKRNSKWLESLGIPEHFRKKGNKYN